MKYYVDACVSASGDGSKEKPFATISEAAKKAQPGDEVIVADGIYREYVDPLYGGTDDKRITYRAANRLGATITGAEIADDWEKVEGSVWKTVIDNKLFGNYNPFDVLVSGDWFNAYFTAHTGDVFLNGRSLYEVNSYEEVVSPPENNYSWDHDFSSYTWYAKQDSDRTIIFANFHDKDPANETVEISVRKNCFLPSKEGIGYITLDGFKVCMAATQWAPPTAYQDGMVGPHWSKGWIIENCEIFESKCSGISLGKYLQPENDNKWLKEKFKDGTQTERDCICQARNEGWSKEKIGSHIIRNNDIHDCGQTGIVGHLGGVFSVIENNHIHHINNKQNLAGAEIGGIKMHAAIDVIIRKNHFHHCTRGLWLDWQAQGTRVTCNLFHDNSTPFDHLLEGEGPANLGLGEDIFVEVSHGPTLVDNNILLSDRAMKLPTQGVALVHNLITGSLTAVGRGVDNGAKTLKSARYTPYHVPHSTDIAGFMTILHGDMRFYNNVFIQLPVRAALAKYCEIFAEDEWDDGNLAVGTIPYNDYMTQDEWESEFTGYCGMGSEPSDRYYIPLPVWMGGNAYFNGAKPCDKEEDAFVDNEHTVSLKLITDGKDWRVETDLTDYLPSDAKLISTDTLGKAFEPEQRYEAPDGSDIVFDTDIYGNKREGAICAGPIVK